MESNKILDCVIIDDEPLALGLIEGYVKKTPFLNLVGKYGNAVEALQAIKDNPPHLMFLDIQMPELNGLDFSKMVKDQTKIIFTTAFQQYAIDGFKVNALDYLLKPISYADFLNSAQKALDWYTLTEKSTATQEPQKKKSIFVKSEYKLRQIELDKILYIEGLKDYVKIYVEDEQYPILSLMRMKTLEEELPSDQFVRIHRSYIVQPKKIKEIERNRIIFGKTYIPISESYKDEFQEFLRKNSILNI